MSHRSHLERANTRLGRQSGAWRYARPLLAMAIVAVMVMGSLLVRVLAAPGGLDTTFHGDGKQTTTFGVNKDNAYAVAIQTDGKIVVAGTTTYTNSTSDFALARYNINGGLDTSFSGDGKLTTDFSPYRDEAFAVAIQSDGKIVVGGFTQLSNIDPADFALARYNGNGSLDDGTMNDSTPNDEFGINGKVTTDFFGSGDAANAMAIQTDGKIVAAGFAVNPNAQTTDFGLARYDSTGTLDMTFSGDGKQTTGFFNPSNDYGEGIAIQADGKIVVAGVTVLSGGNRDFAVARYYGN